MHPSSNPWKHQKTLQLSDFFRGQRKDALGTNELKDIFEEVHDKKKSLILIVIWVQCLALLFFLLRFFFC